MKYYKRIATSLAFLAMTFFFAQTTFAQSPLPQATSCGTTHENGICKVNILEPKELTKDIIIKEPNFLEQLLARLLSLTEKLGFKPDSVQNYHPRSELQNQSEVPEEIMPSGDPKDRLPGFLGDEGVWGVTLPEFATEPTNTEGFEKAYEDAYFPENIDKITQP